MSKKRFLPPVLISLLMLILSGCHREPAAPIAFFYLETCPGCDSYIKAEDLGDIVMELVKSRLYEGRSWNMAHPSEEAGETLMKMIEERNLPDISYALPLLFVGDDYYVGYEDIEANLINLLDSLTEK